MVHSGPQPVEEEKALKVAELSLPLKGPSISVSSVNAFWRAPKAGDIVRPNQRLIPEVEIELAGGSNLFRAFFYDQEGRKRGDDFTRTVVGGKMDGQSKVSVVCSEGYENEMRLVEVRSGDLEPWYVELHECKDLDAPLNEQTLMVRFAMTSDRSDQ